MNSTQSSRLSWVKNGRQTVILGFEHICPIAASNLDWLLEKSDAKVVISSTWRKFHEPEEWHEKMAEVCPSIVGRVIGKTPCIRREKMSMPSVPRGHEIHKFLEDNGYLETPFVVFDDDRDMDKVEKNFIWVDGDCGLTYKHIFEVFVRWGISPEL